MRPSLVTVSCGVRNRFGHPRPEALARLRAVGALPLRLDRVGSVQWPEPHEVMVANPLGGDAIQVKAFEGRAVGYVPLMVSADAMPGLVTLRVVVGSWGLRQPCITRSHVGH